MDLTEAEDIKKRQQEYTELYKKDLNDPDNHNGMMTYLEPDILEGEVKLALRSITAIKASQGDRIPVELFQILTDDAVKVLHSICQLLGSAVQNSLEGEGPWENGRRPEVPQLCMLLAEKHLLPLAMLGAKI